MVTKYHIALLLFLLPGCKGCGNADHTQSAIPSSDNHALGFAFDEESNVTGIRVKIENENSFHADELDSMYREVAACMGIDPPKPGPLVIYQKDFTRDFGNSDFNTGRFYTDTKTIVIDASQSKSSPIGFPNVQPISDQETRHEMIHFLLFVTTGDSDVLHKSPFFEFGDINCAQNSWHPSSR